MAVINRNERKSKKQKWRECLIQLCLAKRQSKTSERASERAVCVQYSHLMIHAPGNAAALSFSHSSTCR